MPEPIDFFFDLSSPYSYVASSWIDDLAARHGRAVRWHAILLGATFQAAELKSPVSYPLKREYSLRDFARTARFHGVPYVEPTTFPIATVNAARVFWWLHDTRGPAPATAWARACWTAYFTRGEPLGDVGVLRALATAQDVDPDAAERAWTDPVWKDRLRRANDEAVAKGVFGAPFFLVDGEPFWGNDRRPQLERWLAEGPF